MSKRIATLAGALLCAPLLASADAVIYRCVGKAGLVYQDHPCAGARETQNRVLVTGPIAGSTEDRAAPPPRDGSAFAAWLERTSKENRVREAEQRVRALERRKEADEAEFAAMIADVEQKRDDAAAGVADLPTVYELDNTRLELRQNYVERAQQNQAELNLAREALAAEQER